MSKKKLNTTRSTLVLRLYVSGDSPNSKLARRNLEVALERFRPSQIQLDVIDVQAEPLRTLSDGVMVTPTLMRMSPLPVEVLVGDLSNTQAVLATLGLPPSV